MQFIMGGYQPERSVLTQALRILAERLSALSDGALVAEVIPDALDRPGGSLPDLLRTGRIDMCYINANYFSDHLPDLTAVEAPFQNVERQAIFAALDGELGEALQRVFIRETPFQAIGFWDNGLRHISNSVRPIHSPEDCRGLRMRTLDSLLYRSSFAALGFAPVSLPIKQLEAAMQRGEVDGQENPLTNMINFDLGKYQRYVSLTAHTLNISYLLVRYEWMAKLPSELRVSIVQAAREASARQRDMAIREDEECRSVLEAQGVSIMSGELLDLDAFRSATEPAVADWRKRLDPAVLKMVANAEIDRDPLVRLSDKYMT